MRQGENQLGPWFLCHIGHEFSAADMDVRQMAAVDHALTFALRTLNERVLLCGQFADAAARAHNTYLQRHWLDLQLEVEMKARVVAGLIDRAWDLDRSRTG